MSSLRPQCLLHLLNSGSISTPQLPARTQLPAGLAAQQETTGLTDSQVSQRRGGHTIVGLQEEAFLRGALEAQSLPLISAASQYGSL